MIFDHAAELPVATVRRARGSHVELVASDLRRWFAARWQWFRPRTIPMVIAFVGMLGVLQAVDHLSTPPAHTAETATMSGAIFVEGKLYRNGIRLPALESSGYTVQLIIQH